VFCIEFPYHSKKYRSLRRMLPSQYYSFDLVRRAIKRRVLIVLMRSRARWLSAIPELSGYGYYELSSPQNGALTPRNLSEGFDRIVEILVQVR